MGEKLQRQLNYIDARRCFQESLNVYFQDVARTPLQEGMKTGPPSESQIRQAKRAQQALKDQLTSLGLKDMVPTPDADDMLGNMQEQKQQQGGVDSSRHITPLAAPEPAFRFRVKGHVPLPNEDNSHLAQTDTQTQTQTQTYTSTNSNNNNMNMSNNSNNNSTANSNNKTTTAAAAAEQTQENQQQQQQQERENDDNSNNKKRKVSTTRTSNTTVGGTVPVPIAPAPVPLLPPMPLVSTVMPNGASTVPEDQLWGASNVASVTSPLKTFGVDLAENFVHQSPVCSVAFSHNGLMLATGSEWNAQLFNVETGEKITQLEEPKSMKTGRPSSRDEHFVRCVCFSHDDTLLAASFPDYAVKIWNIKERKLIHSLTGHTEEVFAVDFSSNGKYVISGSADATARLWDLQTGQLVRIFGGPEEISIKKGLPRIGSISSVAISPDSRFVALGSLDKIIQIWDLETGDFVETLKGHAKSVYSVAWSPDGRCIISGSKDETVKLWDVTAGSGLRRPRCRLTYRGHKDLVLSVSYAPSGDWFISGSKDNTIRFWDIREEECFMTLQGHNNSVINVAVHMSGQRVASASGDCKARIWKCGTDVTTPQTNIVQPLLPSTAILSSSSGLLTSATAGTVTGVTPTAKYTPSSSLITGVPKALAANTPPSFSIYSARPSALLGSTAGSTTGSSVGSNVGSATGSAPGSLVAAAISTKERMAAAFAAVLKPVTASAKTVASALTGSNNNAATSSASSPASSPSSSLSSSNQPAVSSAVSGSSPAQRSTIVPPLVATIRPQNQTSTASSSASSSSSDSDSSSSQDHDAPSSPEIDINIIV
eukprot:GILJ01004734.1.p1 GENE.GILJ01004734.1~~GILJ01004734.1.p1  ORF type:complete len:824 (+),score=148.01 GILJ01004734.1:503-2974(+)